MSKQVVESRLDEAGLGTERYIDVQDGEKASVDHTLLTADDVEGNYGIYATAGDPLVILDIDDYDDVEDRSGLTALTRLPPTFEQSSPHGGTHRLYAVEEDEEGRFIAAVLEDEFGKENLKPSWGEVRVSNQYVVGAGSQLDGCDKEWCDECATEDGGRYSIESSQEISTISPELLVDVLQEDPNYRDEDGEEAATETPELDGDPDVEEVLEFALTESNDEKLQRLWRGDYSDYGDDRSKAESALAYKLSFWLKGNKQAVRRAMNGQNLPESVARPSLKKWPDRDDDSYRESVLEAVDEQDEFFKPSRTSNPDPASIDYDELERAEAIIQAQTAPDEPAGGLFHRNGCYGYWKDRKVDGEREQYFDTVCNFTLETLSYLNTYEGELLNIRVHPQSPLEESYDVQVHPTVFNETRSFKEEIVRGRTTRYEPKGKSQQALNDLRESVGRQPAPRLRGREHIGLHGKDYDEWVTPKGTLRADGWAEDPENLYYEKGGSMDVDSSLAEKWALDSEDGDEFDQDVVASVLEKIGWTRRPDRGLPVLGWFYAAPLKPIIHDTEGEFALLQVTGGTETGKTSSLEMFYDAFGAEPSPFGCGDKAFTIEKKLAGSCGLPIWLDEYKPSDLPKGKLKWLHRRLREVTREKLLSKGTPSLGEVTFKFRAPVVFSGEQQVTEPAVARRAVITTFTGQSTAGEYQENFCELTGASYTDADGNERYPEGKDLSQHALAYYRFILDLDREEVKDLWHSSRDQTADILRELDIGSLDDSELRGLQTVVFGFHVFQKFAEAVGVDLDELPDEENLKRSINHVAQNIGPDGRRREHIDEFLELITQAASAEYIEEDVHYRVMTSRKWEKEVLAFHMPTTFSAVKRYVRDYNVESDYNILGKTDYIDSFSDKVEEEGTYSLAVNKEIRGLENGRKAVFIDPDRASEKLGDGFNLGAFTHIDEDEELPGDDEDDDGLRVKATPVEALDTAGNPYTTVTVQVTAWESTPDEVVQKGGPTDSGTVQDATGPIDVVDFFGCEASSKLSEGSYVRISNARVSTYEGSLQLEIVQNTTTVTEIQAGAGYTESEATDVGQERLDEATDKDAATTDEAAPDGGDRSGESTVPDDASGRLADAQRLVQLVKSAGKPMTKMQIISKASTAHDLDPERVQDALQFAVSEKGLLIEDGDEYIVS